MARTWREYFEQWTNQPMYLRSTGDPQPETHFAAIAEHVCRSLALSEGDNVLDVGCDSGLVTEKVASRVASITGVDFIEAFIADAMRLKQAPNSHYMVADAQALPFPNKAFDKGYCYNVIHGLPDREYALRIIREMTRVCKSVILVGDVPDVKKKGVYYRRRWQNKFVEGNVVAKARMVIAVITPCVMRRYLKRMCGIQTCVARSPGFVWHDMNTLKRDLQKDGCECTIFAQPYPLHDWYYRSSMVLRLPNTASVCNKRDG